MHDVPYYAHVRENANGNKEYQTVAQHLIGTAEPCRKFAAAFGAEADGELAGLAHDMGKCTEEFQNRLLNGGPVVDHATAGVMACARRGNPLNEYHAKKLLRDKPGLGRKMNEKSARFLLE